VSGLVAGLAGAGGAADQAGSYYTDALNKLVNQYGSPAADTFSKEFISSLQPGFKQQQQGLIGQENALGIANSGAAKANLSSLYGNQSASEAQGVAPLYQEALGQYGSLLSQEPGAQNTAYANAIQNFYQALQQGAAFAGDAFGVPSAGPGSQPQGSFYSGPSNPDNPYADQNSKAA